MQWYPPLEDMNYVDSEYFDLNDVDKYVYTFYYSVLIYGYNDLFPRNPIENITLVMLLLASTMVTNFFVSDIATLIDKS